MWRGGRSARPSAPCVARVHLVAQFLRPFDPSAVAPAPQGYTKELAFATALIREPHFLDAVRVRIAVLIDSLVCWWWCLGGGVMGKEGEGGAGGGASLTAHPTR